MALVNNDIFAGGHQVGVPSQVVRRLALAAEGLEKAVNVLVTARHCASRAYLMGDAQGGLASIEVSAVLPARTGDVLNGLSSVARDISPWTPFNFSLRRHTVASTILVHA